MTWKKGAITSIVKGLTGRESAERGSGTRAIRVSSFCLLKALQMDIREFNPGLVR